MDNFNLRSFLTNKTLYENLNSPRFLLEVSIDQLQSQFVETGKISQEDFDEIVSVANSTSKASNVATWLVSKVVGTKKLPPIIRQEDVYKYGEYFNVFFRQKNRYDIKDINQIKTSGHLRSWLDDTINIMDLESKDKTQVKGVAKKSKFDKFKLGETSAFIIFKIPKGGVDEDGNDLYATSCKLGSGTQWCTATNKTREHFDGYTKGEGTTTADDLYIAISKTDKKEKYQFHYADNWFMDRNDAPIPVKKVED